MSFIDQVRKKRQKLADVLVDDEYRGLRELVEELYPDKAHFIFELLQNAEDANATRVEFRLSKDRLVFAHDGQPFSEQDVWGITNIGKGTKKEDEDKIGQFGVGFKAVFAYSETPSIWSPTFNFRISDLVLPTEIHARDGDGKATVFEFPFNNAKKDSETAFSETADGLQSLSEEILIFLQHINFVKWTISGGAQGGLKRVERSRHLIEVQKDSDGTTIARSCFLRFSMPVEGLSSQNVSIAFPLERKVEASQATEIRDVAKYYRIVSAAPGRVFVYFPAEKEVSGLRFHLHAPFVPELSRASVKDTPANDPLFVQLATLASESLVLIRDLGLLTVDFLNVLPHGGDALPTRYRVIENAIRDAMKSQPLTPTQSRRFRPARELLQSKPALKDLLPERDLNRIIEEDQDFDWAIAAPQRNSHADRFLSSLEIRRWDIDQFLALLLRRRSEEMLWDSTSWRYRRPEPDEEFDTWFESKSVEWLQRLYAMFFRERSDDEQLAGLKSAKIVRLSNGSFSRPEGAFFSKPGTQNSSYFPRVDTAVYSSGKSNADKEASRNFLEEVGVREVGHREVIQAILTAHYGASPDRTFEQHAEDLRRFVELIRREPAAIKDFVDQKLLLSVSDEWSSASGLFLDSPFQSTGLAAFYEAWSTAPPRKAISRRYYETGLTNIVCELALAVGIESRVEIAEVSCRHNPNSDYLVDQAPGNPSRHKVDRDFWIEGIEQALQVPSLALARLLWTTLARQPSDHWTRAKYRANQTQSMREHDSRLVCCLREGSWIPQRGGGFVTPADADYRLLPDDFEFARGWNWLSAIAFGENVAKRTEEYRKKKEFAAELGFDDDESLNDAKWFAQLDPASRRLLKSEYQSRNDVELPERAPTNPDRRAEKVASLAIDAPKDEKEIRSRSVSAVTPSVKKEIRPYLREQYTNADGVMICQICQHGLPFTLANGDPYFDTIVLVSDTDRVYFQNYVALCPNHAAMFKHANESESTIRDLVESQSDCKIPVVLAGKSHDIYFTETHLADVRSVLASVRNLDLGSQ